MYAQLPFSCSLCKAFGHSLARCLDNPKAKKKKQQQQQKKHNAKHNEADDSLMKECGNGNDQNRNDVYPQVIGEIFGCDIVQDETDKTLSANQEKIGDYLMTSNHAQQTSTEVNTEIETVDLEGLALKPLNLHNDFDILDEVDQLQEQTEEIPTSNRKKD